MKNETSVTVDEIISAWKAEGDRLLLELKYLDWKAFERWKAAKTINLIFRREQVPVPPIPIGYEEYAQWWYDHELKAFK